MWIITLIVLLVVILLYVNSNESYVNEHLTPISNESVQNLASVYNVDNINVTNSTATNTATAKKLNVTDAATINGKLRVDGGVISKGIDPTTIPTTDMGLYSSNSQIKFITNNAPFIWSASGPTNASPNPIMSLDQSGNLSINNSLKIQNNTFQPEYFSIYPLVYNEWPNASTPPKTCLRALDDGINLKLDTYNPNDPACQFYWNGYKLISRKFNKCVGVQPNAKRGDWKAPSNPNALVTLQPCAQQNNMYWKTIQDGGCGQRFFNVRAGNPLRLNQTIIDVYNQDCGGDCTLIPY